MVATHRRLGGPPTIRPLPFIVARGVGNLELARPVIRSHLSGIGVRQIDQPALFHPVAIRRIHVAVEAVKNHRVSGLALFRHRTISKKSSKTSYAAIAVLSFSLVRVRSFRI